MEGKILFQEFSSQDVEQDFHVSNLTNHSQKVTPGCAFFAYAGTKVDGRQFISQALEHEPSAIVVETNNLENFELPVTNIPMIYVQDLDVKVGDIANRFFGEPSKQMFMTGVTGTNGKTTISHLIYQAFNQLNVKAAQIGTLGVFSDQAKIELNLTTPDAIEVHRLLSTLAGQGTKAVAMEVSSHALSQNRTQGVSFDNAIFTNLTPEHLDYHETMQAYGQEKLKLFQKKSLSQIVLNDEDLFTQTILSHKKNEVETFLYTTQKELQGHYYTKPKAVTTQSFQMTANGIEASLDTPWGKGVLKSKLLGQFNLSNLLAALITLCQYGIELKEALHVLSKISPATGRMQTFGGVSLPHVIVDYAHTPDALKNALIAARASCKRKLWCVFGCGGNRDSQKRQMMGDIANSFADKVIITNDNPRDESPSQIIEDILSGIQAVDSKKIMVEEDRQKAIEHAVQSALSFDVILVAGKGHEAMQTIGADKIPFSDIECVKELLGEA